MAGCRWDERGHSGIRPIAASDGEALREFARSLSFESRYLPFMSAVNELDSDTVERLTKIDHRRDVRSRHTAAAMLTSASSEDLLIRPRSKSLILG